MFKSFDAEDDPGRKNISLLPWQSRKPELSGMIQICPTSFCVSPLSPSLLSRSPIFPSLLSLYYLPLSSLTINPREKILIEAVNLPIFVSIFLPRTDIVRFLQYTCFIICMNTGHGRWKFYSIIAFFNLNASKEVIKRLRPLHGPQNTPIPSI